MGSGVSTSNGKKAQTTDRPPSNGGSSSNAAIETVSLTFGADDHIDEVFWDGQDVRSQVENANTNCEGFSRFQFQYDPDRHAQSVLVIAAHANQPGTSASFYLKAQSSNKRSSQWNFVLGPGDLGCSSGIRCVSMGMNSLDGRDGPMERPKAQDPPRGWCENDFNGEGWKPPTGPSNAHCDNKHDMGDGVWVDLCKYTFYRFKSRKLTAQWWHLGGSELCGGDKSADPCHSLEQAREIMKSKLVVNMAYQYDVRKKKLFSKPTNHEGGGTWHSGCTNLFMWGCSVDHRSEGKTLIRCDGVDMCFGDVKRIQGISSYEQALNIAKQWNETDAVVYWCKLTHRVILKAKNRGCYYRTGAGVLFMWADKPLFGRGSALHGVQIFITTLDGESVATVTVHLSFDGVASLEDKVFDADVPRQRQHLLFEGLPLQDDRRVLAQHGVKAGSTIQLMIYEKKGPLDALFSGINITSAGLRVVGSTDFFRRQIDLGFFDGVVGPTDGMIYMIPSNAERAARFNPKSGAWEAFGDRFPKTEHKWFGGAVSNFDNCVYSIPVSLQVVHKVLKIDPNKGTAKEVGDDVRQFAGDVTIYAWLGVVAGADGCIFAMPHQATAVLRMDPRTGKLSSFGQLEDKGYEKYFSGILGPSGRFIFGIPCRASRVLCIDTMLLTVELIGDKFSDSGRKWLGGDIGGDGCLYCIPLEHTRVLKIDPVARTACLFGPNLINTSQAWHGGCAGLDGCVYGTPYNSDRVLRIDPFVGTASTVGKPIPKEVRRKLYGAVLGPDGNVWFLPCNMPARMLRLKPPLAGHPALLADLLRPEQHTVLCEGLSDLRCYGPLLACALWWEAKRHDGDTELVKGLLNAAAPALPKTFVASIGEYKGRTAWVFLQIFLASLSKGRYKFADKPIRPAFEAIANVVTNRNALQQCFASDSLLDALVRVIYHVYSYFTGVVQLHISHAVTWAEARAEAERCAAGLPTCDDLRKAGVNAGDGVDFWMPVQRPDGREGDYCQIGHHSIRKERYFSHIDTYGPTRWSKNKNAAGWRPGPNSDAYKGAIFARVILDVDAIAKEDEITQYLQTNWPKFFTALRVACSAPCTVFPSTQSRISLLFHVAKSSAILHAPDWRPLPATPDDWSWPPPPLIPLRAACKDVEALGPEAVRATWPALASAITHVLMSMVDAVCVDLAGATKLLATVFDWERKASLNTYRKQLRRARRDPTFPEFKTTATRLLANLTKFSRLNLRVQSTASFPELRATAHALHDRFDEFVQLLSEKCVGATPLKAPLKGCGRALEKLVLYRDDKYSAATEVKAKGLDALDATRLMDVLRGSLECPDFTEIVFVLELLELLDVDLGDRKKAESQGWDLDKCQIRLIHIKDRFSQPTSGGWADLLINFSFVHGDDTQHVMELQLQHAQMLVVRKEGKEHSRYNSFRSAYELMGAVGSAPHDDFVGTDDDLPPVEMLKKMMRMQQEMLKKMEKRIHDMEQEMQKERQEMKQHIDRVNIENEMIRFRLKKLEPST